MRPLPFLVAIAMISFAGCVGDTPLVPIPEDQTQSDPIDAFEVRMTDCIEAGGVSTYPKQFYFGGPPEPFEMHDIQEDVGGARISSAFFPIIDESAGHWHMTIECASSWFEGEDLGPMTWGWVGARVHAPPFDASGHARQFFVTDLSIHHEGVLDTLQTLLDLHASEMWNGVVERLPGGLIHTLLDDAEHGVYETHWLPTEHRTVEETTNRFWMLVADQKGGSHDHLGFDGAAKATYHPISIDLARTGTSTHLVSPDNSAWFSHSRTDHHGAAGGAAGQVVGVAYEGFDMTMTLGPRPPVVFEESWFH